MYKSSPIPLFYPGLNDSPFYRIPSLLMLNDGTIVAGSDQRLDTRSDWGKINPVLLFKKPGQDFADFTKVIDMDAKGTTNAPFNIDMCLVESGDKLYMLIDAFKSGGNFWAAKNQESYKKVGGEKYLIIFDRDGNEFYVKDDGSVYDNMDKKTNLNIQMTDTMPFTNLYNIYEDDKVIGNIYKDTSDYQIHQTSHLWLTHSTDKGRTWQCPVDITRQVADPRMKFLGACPGVGLALTSGRLLFPTYYSIGDDYNKENVEVIYTDDEGKTFHRSRSINFSNDGLIGDLEFNTSESQLVELNNGHVMIFVRNTSGKVLYAVSEDMGETFSELREVDFDSTSTCMVSVLKIERNKREYILLSNPDGPDRTNGSIKILEVKNDGMLEFVGRKMINDKHYGYSCLAHSPKKDTYALLYEQEELIDGEKKDIICYTEFDQEWLFDL
ncbi:sialidase family protein [Anaerococcus sp. Marseille-Q7828]|uniref:sialidase family protein n=1 Tax=Anaerococcus sp. Marseille-Q7828 TaxID=3036300 RepID=UPI0024AE1102|nr:sialidase family protein [Anaerococcus sp. Marseille-Q7828]